MKGPTARRRAAKAGRLKRAENKNKEQVRRRDVTCRFPWCRCHTFGLFLEVSHGEHKGMGGDPTGERSAPELMIFVCNWRHKEGRYAIDKKNLRWRPLTPAGANGAIAWDVRVPWLLGNDWVEVARETAWIEVGQRPTIRTWESTHESSRAVFQMLRDEMCNGLLDKKSAVR